MRILISALFLSLLATACGDDTPLLKKKPAPAASDLLDDSGVGNGNGGDPKIMMFKKAKTEGANWVSKVALKPEALTDHSNQAVRDFVANEQFLRELAADINTSPHDFPLTASSAVRCAWTNDLAANVPGDTPGADPLDVIRFSLAQCEAGLQSEGRLFATLTLIHESLHHMVRKIPELAFANVDAEETFCNEAALAIAEAHDQMVQEGTSYWSDLSLEGNPSARGHHTAAWTGATGAAATAERMIVWGGCSEADDSIYGCGQYYKDGGLYDPKTDTWTKMSDTGAPEARAHHVSIFTGKTDVAATANRFVVYGGCTKGDACETYLATGGLYDVAQNKWTALSTTGAPAARASHSAVWTGTHVIVWGGESGANTPNVPSKALATGAKLDVATNKWSDITTPSVEVLSPRRDHTAVWAGDKMIVFGGCDEEVVWFCKNYYNTGAIYDPASNEWTALPTDGAPDARRFHSVVWTGKYMIVWGGEGKAGTLKTGGVYDPAANKWYRTKTLGPDARSRHTAVWTGDRMVVFGGETSNDVYATDTYVYRPAVTYSGTSTGEWSKVPIEFDPIRVKGHSAIWTGSDMVIWGGQNRPNAFYNTGAAFHPGDAL